ncbi:UPF0725 protein At1g23950 isoform X1 [Raphanus sativus]|uniref:UPF0725 protein At1g23950 isoform X1 n=1 Tax=Raphanus sativus TaxID=3726 RepID=A0A9W3BWJ6_RAPSA|nr:UPF0725 protein At1g23950 isoform X1 [Raphanus sativus]
MCGMITGLLPIDCVRERGYPYPVLVNLYAKMGLHRYNMLKGTNFQLDSLVKFNMLQNCVSSVYMTLLAHEPAPDPLAKTFQVRVDEHKANSLAFECSIARIKDEVITKKPFVPHFHGDALAYGIFKGELPNWPSDDALNDGKRFYLVRLSLKESEWQANDWISMYLELVICAHDRRIRKRDVYSQLEILEVAIETGVEDVEPPIETGVEDVEPPNERLNATSVNVYIKFKGMENVITPMMIFESGEHVEHKAVVRRVLNEHSGDMTLSGKFCGGLSTKKKIQSSKKRTRSD